MLILIKLHVVKCILLQFDHLLFHYYSLVSLHVIKMVAESKGMNFSFFALLLDCETELLAYVFAAKQHW